MMKRVQEEALAPEVERALYDVFDPEIPALSIMDLGMVRSVTSADGHALVQLMPTFMGCPALSIIRRNVIDRVLAVEGVTSADVEFVYDEPWTTERMTETAKVRLREFGIAPPACGLLQMNSLTAECPYCRSSHTRLDSLFGPTACRSVFYCEDCHQPFEAMKPV
ncbi:1,2-phenylacetyl-CoA epoxidase subunit PaaD [Alicyclobacillus sp. ALC3]|uniref:1,2-phenylacetyl-CoA epoxidase subunit PaaD n=1 Tax=Alicyclobacillus sp. ALC3 TaxID=2796143 RepID=UPI0023785B9D|nr:1,2-phenylacetyl-CoA epoxidase subunit PaaD [Alicyclobacillus sp. ALC3]